MSESLVLAAPAVAQPNRSMLRRLAAMGAWSLVAHALSAGSMLAASIVIARQLGAGPLGHYSYLQWLLRVLPTFLALGMPTALTKIVAEKYAADDPAGARALFRFTIRAHLGLAVIGGAVAAIAIAAHQASVAVAVIVVAGSLATLVSSDVDAFLAGQQRFRVMTLASLVSSLAQIGLVVAGAVLHLGWVGFSGLYVAALTVSALALWACLPARPDVVARVHRRELRQFVGFSVTIGVTVIVDLTVWGRPEILFLNHFRSATEVGLYSAGLRLASLAGLIPVVASRALMPEFAALRGSGDHAALERAYPRVCVLLAIVSMPLAFGGAAVAGHLVPLVYGGGFGRASESAALLIGGSAVNAIATATVAALVASSRARVIAQLGMIAVAVNVLLDYLVIPRYGVVGAASVNVAIQVSCVLVGAVYVQRALGLRYPWGMVARVALASVLAAAAARVGASVGGPLALVVAAACGGATLLIALAALRVVGLDEARDLLRRRHPGASASLD